MEAIDAKAFTLIMLATTSLVGLIKKLFPVWVAGKEPALAQILPIIGVVILKLVGVFKGTDTIDALIWAFNAGLGSQVLHDYVVNPLMKNKETKVS